MATNEEPKDLLDWLGFIPKPNWKVARPLGYALGIATILLFGFAIVAAFWTLLQTLITPSTASLSAGTLIVALLGAPFLIWRTIIAHKTLGFQKEGHITDRISKAVEQLGAEKTVKKQLVYANGKKAFELDEVNNENLSKPIYVEETAPAIEVRIGSLLSLERIAQDSVLYDNGRDHVRVMEILCAYIRENSQAPNTRISELGELTRPDLWMNMHWRTAYPDELKRRYDGSPSKNKNESTKGLLVEWVDSIELPREDIFIALEIIGRRSAAQKLVEANWRQGVDGEVSWPFLNLPEKLSSNKNFRKEEIENGYLNRFHNWSEKISTYSGYRLNLRSVNLQRIKLSHLDFSGADFTDSYFDGAHFERTSFVGSNMQNCSAVLTDLKYCNLSFAEINEANLERMRLLYCDLIRARLIGVKLDSTLFDQCDLTAARIEFTRAFHTIFESGVMAECRFKESSSLNSTIAWWNAPLDEAVLDQLLLDHSFGDNTTTINATLVRPSYWPNTFLETSELRFETEWIKWQSLGLRYKYVM